MNDSNLISVAGVSFTVNVAGMAGDIVRLFAAADSKLLSNVYTIELLTMWVLDPFGFVVILWPMKLDVNSVTNSSLLLYAVEKLATSPSTTLKGLPILVPSLSLSWISKLEDAAPNGSVILPLTLKRVTDVWAKIDADGWSIHALPTLVSLVTWESPYNTVRVVVLSPIPLIPAVSTSYTKLSSTVFDTSPIVIVVNWAFDVSKVLPAFEEEVNSALNWNCPAGILTVCHDEV